MQAVAAAAYTAAGDHRQTQISQPPYNTRGDYCTDADEYRVGCHRTNHEGVCVVVRVLISCGGAVAKAGAAVVAATEGAKRKRYASPPSNVTPLTGDFD